MPEDSKYDVIIVGAGVSGLTAGIYTCRKSLKTLIISKDVGGQALIAKEIENYPGVERTGGADLVQKVLAQAQSFGAEIILDEVESVLKKGEGEFHIQTSHGEYLAKAVIIASGKIPRDLNVPGEDRFKGMGVSYCAICDAPLYKNKKVLVVGDGSYAFDAVILLSKYAKEVHFVLKRKDLPRDQEDINLFEETKNVTIYYDTIVKEVKGTFKVVSVVLESIGKNVFELPVDGVFVELGYEIKVEPFKNLVTLDERKQVVVTGKNETSTSGVFASGDVTNTPFKQFVISASEGAKAALSAYEYVQKISGKPAVTIDWHS
ncbi:MAG: FAD-dependent oxidoreductase [Nitrososphaeria archaeon]|jgi:thioredoxin reductase (NADPH)